MWQPQTNYCLLPPSSWRDRIQFDVLFGIATSVELFQARLLKSTARQLRGAQFDVVQADSVLERVVKAAVAATDAALRIGPTLLQSLIERQRGQVAGIQAFISALKVTSSAPPQATARCSPRLSTPTCATFTQTR